MAEYPCPNIETVYNQNDYGVLTNDDFIRDYASKIYASSKCVYDGVGLKSANSDGTTGITHDGYNFYALENLGFTKKVYLNGLKTIVPLLTSGQFINLVSAATTLKVTSDSASDIGQQLFILGYDDSFNQVFDVFVLNSTSPVLGIYSASFFRIIGGQIINSNGRNTPGGITVGNLYVVPSSYNTFTLGVPSDLSKCVATSSAGTGNIYTGTISIPPKADLYASELVVSLNSSGKTNDIAVYFFSRMGVDSGWRRLAELDMNASAPTILLHQGGFPSLNTDASGSLFHDLMLVCERTSGSNTSASDDVNLSTFLTAIRVIKV